MMTDTSAPPVWFRLPPGFHHVSPKDRGALDNIAGALGSPEAQQELSALMDGLDELAGHHVAFTAVGIHPEEPAGVSTSLFSLAVHTAEPGSLRLNVARTALALAGSPLWNNPERRQIDLPSTLPCFLVAGTISIPGTDQHMFQAKVATAHADGVHVLVLDLTSAATCQGDSYSDILEAVAYTLTFSDPNPTPSTAPRTSRILEVLL
ncbi:hypothetical protein OG625_06600 [Streptomyces sp. NBC_01351]|uniref:hypothetical protein n=1 Tax=Streptomyces sp. NBC_01351 TaxID=2903833 RepID=UPI002E33DE38|nr:hypothetical protein [Streptomyces sp. NBC_01351]